MDGAAFKYACGAHIVIMIDKDKNIKGWLKAGMGTNTSVEVIGMWSLLFVSILGIKHLQVLGKSQVIINWD